jgi:hypothetical protein
MSEPICKCGHLDQWGGKNSVMEIPPPRLLPGEPPMSLTTEEFMQKQIDRLHGMLEAEQSINRALRRSLEEKEADLRDWQRLAVELGAYAAVEKDKAMMTLDCSLKVAAPLLALAKDRTEMLTQLLSSKVLRPMLAECDRQWGVQP